MIAINETDPTAAEVPFFLPLSADTFTGPGLTGHAFVAGEVQIKLPGAGWINADTTKIVEKGYGRYCVQLTAAQCTTPGIIYVVANVTGAQPYRGVEQIGTAGGDIVENDAAARFPFFLANLTDPVEGSPITGHVFVTGEVRICLPGGSYADADVTKINEVGNGEYELLLTPAQTAHRGKVFLFALVSGAERYEAAATILTGAGSTSSSAGTGTSGGTVSVVSPLSTNAAGYVDHVAAAINRLPVQFRSQ